MILYADTSFLISLYVPDANSSAAVASVRPLRFPLVLTLLGELEFANSVALRIFRKEMTAAEAASVLAHFRQDITAGILRLGPLPLSVFEEAMHLSQKYSTQLASRSLDVLHVAAALSLGARRFYTFDRTQSKLARLVGLRAF